MSDQIPGGNRFRAALHGFNREDVVAYIEKTTQQHETELRTLQEKNDTLSRQLAETTEALESARQNSVSQEDYESAKRRITELLTENQSLGDRIAELEDSLVKASEQGSELTDVTEQDLTAPIPTVNEVLPADVAPSRDYTELELAAYRRAELAERAARERAADVYREISSVFQHGNTKLDTGRQDLEQMTRAIQENVNQLMQVLNSIRSAYHDTELSFEAVSDRNRPMADVGTSEND